MIILYDSIFHLVYTWIYTCSIGFIVIFLYHSIHIIIYIYIIETYIEIQIYDITPYLSYFSASHPSWPWPCFGEVEERSSWWSVSRTSGAVPLSMNWFKGKITGKPHIS